MKTLTLKVFKTFPSEQIIEVKPIQKQIRHHSIYRLLARQEIDRPWYLRGYTSFMKDHYPVILRMAQNYKQETDNSSIEFKTVEGKSIKLPMCSRFSDAYVKKLRRKFKFFEDLSVLNTPCLYLVFTADPKMFQSYKDMRNTMVKCLNNELTYLKRLAKRRETFFLYERTFETQKNGMLHINLIVFGLRWLFKSDQEHIEKLWLRCSENKGSIEYRKVKHKETNDFVNRYVTKYILKQYKDYSINDDETVRQLSRDMVIGWGCGWRSYSLSKDLDYELRNAGLGITFSMNKNAKLQFVRVIRPWNYKSDMNFEVDYG